MAGLNKSSMFVNGIIKMANGSIDFDTHLIKAMLVKVVFPNTDFTDTNRETYDFLDDIIAGSRSKDVFVLVNTADLIDDDANNNVMFASGTVSLTFTVVTNGTSCRGIVIFKSSGGESTSPLICYNHLSANITADGGSVTINLAADGLFTASYDS